MPLGSNWKFVFVIVIEKMGIQDNNQIFKQCNQVDIWKEVNLTITIDFVKIEKVEKVEQIIYF